MKEREILNRIKDFVRDFDHYAETAMKKVVLPATLGMGLALGQGCGPEDDPGKRPQPTQERGAKAEGADAGTGPVALYAAPFPGDPPPVAPEYAAPFPDPGPAPLYAAPMPAGECTTDVCGTDTPVNKADGTKCYCDDQCVTYGDCCDNKATTCDDGPVALYAAPFPTPDPAPEYAAPFPNGDGQCTPNVCNTDTAVKKGEGYCYCDDNCSKPEYNDCCDNKVVVCDTAVALYAAPFPGEGGDPE